MNELIRVLGNTEDIGIFNPSCFCSHRTEVSGFLSDLQLQKQWDSTTPQQMNPIVLLVMKSKWEMKLQLEQEKLQDSLSQKPHEIQRAWCWFPPELGGSSVGAQSQRCSRCCGEHPQGDIQLCPIPGKSRVPLGTSSSWLNKPIWKHTAKSIRKGAVLKRDFVYFNKTPNHGNPLKSMFLLLLQPGFATWLPRDQGPGSIGFPWNSPKFSSYL